MPSAFTILPRRTNDCIQWRIQDLQTGDNDEAPVQAPIGGGGVWGGVPHPIFFFNYVSQNGDFIFYRCILGTIFYSSRRRRGVGVGRVFF